MGRRAPPTPGRRPAIRKARGTAQASTNMQFSILTTKTESFYTACSPELALISYGVCRDEAVNNLQEEVLIREQAGGEGSHAQ